MTKPIDSDSELREHVEARIGPVLDRHWEETCNGNWHPPYEDADVEEAIRTIRTLRNQEKSLDQPFDVGLETYLVAEQIDLNKRVLDLRRDLFGATTPPFSSSEAAEGWIRQVVLEETGIELAKNERLKTVEFSWSPVPLGSSAPCSHTDEQFPTANRGVLERMALLSEQIASQLQCSPGQAARFILLGEMPDRKAITVRTFFGSRPGVRSLVITIRDSSVTVKDLVDRYKDLRKRVWGTERASPGSLMDLKLIELCMNMPDASWGEIHRAWNSTYPRDSIEKLDTFQKRCNRLIKKRWRPRQGRSHRNRKHA